ncbi:hypothetical protein PSR33_03025 [Latilactobacillus curvatus]|uniref:Adhesin isopeptide-forming adherence domain-containing protein n=1 Tax=Latilactobacillus curvatus TaxID=28038 RepID=A0AAJ5RIP2_LATCU|nr:hypothetical protein [Latilactobacillus curvatus]WDC92538.1 hypothetical protein PSR33_03025 [Latilactobacillus curvatus]
MLRKKNFLLIAFVIFLFSLGDLTAFSKTVRADNIDPTSIASKNELSIKNIVGETAKVTAHSSNISDSNITSPRNIYTSFPSGSSEISVNIPGNPKNSKNSNISSDTGLDGTTSITVTYGKDSNGGVGTYQGKQIYAVITYDNFKYNDSWKNSRDSAKIEFCQDLYGGVNFTMPLQSMEVKVKFFYKSDDSAVNDSAVTLGTDSYLTIGSLNYHVATYPSADFQAAEFVTMKGGQYSDVYLTSAGHTSVKAYDPNYTINDHSINGYAGTKSDSTYNGSIFAGVNSGTWATYKYDYLGSSHFADGGVTYKLNNQTEIDMRIGMLDYYQYTSNMWFSLSSESLWNAPPETPTKAVDDPSGNNVDYNDTSKELFAGTDIVYKIAQQVGDLGVDMMTPYTSFTYRDELPDNVTFLGTGKIVAESSKGTEIKSWDFSTNSKDNSSVGTLSSTTTDRKTTDRKTTVNFAFTADFLSNPLNFNSSTNSHMVYDQRKYILELDCQINANAPTETDIDNTATVGIDKYSNGTNQVTVRVIKYIPQTGSQRLLAIVILIIVLGIAIVVISKHRRAKE